jgi:hypothetical protein
MKKVKHLLNIFFIIMFCNSASFCYPTSVCAACVSFPQPDEVENPDIKLQQVGAPHHFCNVVRVALNDKFPER